MVSPDEMSFHIFLAFSIPSFVQWGFMYPLLLPLLSPLARTALPWPGRGRLAVVLAAGEGEREYVYLAECKPG